MLIPVKNMGFFSSQTNVQSLWGDFRAKLMYGCSDLCTCPEGLVVNSTRQRQNETRHLAVFSRHLRPCYYQLRYRVFSRHKQIFSEALWAPRGTGHLFVTGKDPVLTGKHAQIMGFSRLLTGKIHSRRLTGSSSPYPLRLC